METEALQPLFPLQPRKAHQEKQNSVYGGDGRGKSHQGQIGIGKRRHEQGDRNTDQEGGADSLNHDGQAVSASVEVADAGEKNAGEDAFCGKAPQISGALGDDLRVGGEEGGKEAAAEKAGEEDEDSSVQPESMAVKKPFQARSFLPAPMFCATKADRLCMTEEGISMMKDTIFCATPYPAEGMSPMLLTMELMTRKEICTMVS